MGLYCSHPSLRGSGKLRGKIGSARCVFSKASYASVESGAVAAEHGTSCAAALSSAHHSVTGKLLHRLSSAAVSLISPGDCRLCAAPLLRVQRSPVCDECLHHLQTSPLANGCSICCEPLPPDASTMYRSHTDEATLCAACTAERPRFRRAVAFGLYDDFRPAIRLLKFEDVPSLAQPLGSLLASAMLELQADSPQQMAVVPVPLFRGKRPYNQSTLLARSALAILRRQAAGWRLTLHPELLSRTRRTQSQFLLSPAQRRENLRGAFQAAAAAAGRDILLIDDVYTTGATAAECTRVFLAAGARSVRIATLARAGRDVAAVWQPAAAVRIPAQARADPLPSSAALFP